MSNTKHTSGPWELSHAGIGDRNGFRITEYYVRLPGADFALAADIVDADMKPSEANARLIAAAPELLEAAKLVLAWYEAEENHGATDFYERIAMCKRSEDAIRAAIAKATGEQP